MSDFWVRKMKTYFQRIDFDKDGAITQKDFEGMADRFVQREKLDGAKGKELKAKLLQVLSEASSLSVKIQRTEGVQRQGPLKLATFLVLRR